MLYFLLIFLFVIKKYYEFSKYKIIIPHNHNAYWSYTKNTLGVPTVALWAKNPSSVAQVAAEAQVQSQGPVQWVK